jgi:thioredoxin
MPTHTLVPNANTAQIIAPYVDAERFTALVEHARGLALVDFTADWCPPCRMLAPHVEALAGELSGSVVVAKVDVDDQPGLASRFGVLSVPTLIFFRGGQVVDRIVGALPETSLRARVDELRRPRRSRVP